ncbi:MAG: hypothetical protein AAF571_13240 [Verrucomicrobiota bacterium]
MKKYLKWTVGAIVFLLLLGLTLRVLGKGGSLKKTNSNVLGGENPYEGEFRNGEWFFP